MLNLIRKFNAAQKVILIVVIGFLILTAYFITWSYYSFLHESEENSLLRLQGISNSISVQINGDEHEELVKKYQLKNDIKTIQQDSIYFKIHRLLKKNKEANMLKTEIYTMIHDSSENNFFFIVSSSENPYYRHSYQSFPNILKTQYKTGGRIKRYIDENGEWLSAFTPLKNSEGKVIALLQVDQQFDEFIMKAHDTVIKNILISVSIFLFILAVLIRIVRNILIKEERDKKIIEKALQENAIISKQLAQSLEKLTEIDKLRNEMIANISHDLRTPLSTINGFIETLYLKRKEINSEDAERYLRIVLRESNRLSKLISELFELSKLEANQIKLKLVPFSIAELVQDVCQKYYILCKEKNIELSTNLSNHTPYIIADIELIDRVLQNLIDNAIKYNHTNGKIEVVLKNTENFVEVRVINTGIGIDEKEISQIFDRYYKNPSVNSAENSTGLGLAIVNKIITLHGSKIYVESESNKLTSFYFNLPIYNHQKKL
jgi:signal transduction histidine kinase